MSTSPEIAGAGATGPAYVTLSIYRSARRVYGENRLLTVAKFGVMSCTYFFCAGIMVLLTGVYSTLAL